MTSAATQATAGNVRSGGGAARFDKIVAIDALRGIAVLLVICGHSRDQNWIGWSAYVKDHGGNQLLNMLLGSALVPFSFPLGGVAIFFVISGYVIHRSHAVRTARDLEARLHVPDFYWRRLVRIYPALIAALILTALIDQATLTRGHPRITPDRESLAAFLVNLASMQGILGPPFGSNSPLWSLSIEMHFYLVYPLLLMLAARIGVTRTFAVVLAVNAASIALLPDGGQTVFTSYWAAWYSGLYLAHWETRRDRLSAQVLKLAKIVAWGVMIAGIAAGCVLALKRDVLASFQLWSLGTAGVVWLIATSRVRASSLVRALAALGVFSYSIYLIHQPINIAFNALVLGTPGPSFLPVLGSIAIILPAAYLLYLGIERPCLAHLDRARHVRDSLAGASSVARSSSAT